MPSAPLPPIGSDVELELGDDRADLVSHDTYVHGVPHATFARLRRDDPVSWVDEPDGRGFWAVTRYPDVLAVSRQPELFSCAQGIRLEDMTAEECEARRTLMEMDPPQHTALRRLVSRPFTPRGVQQYAELVRGLTRDVLDELDGQIDDLRAAMRWALGTGRADDVLAIAAPAAWYWILRARIPEGLGWIDEALAPELDASPAAQLQGRWARLQLLAHHDSRHEDLEDAWVRASEIATSLEDQRMDSRLSVWWGSHMTFYAPEAGIGILTDGRDRCDEVGDAFWAAYAEGALALGRVFQGRDDLAGAHLQAMAARRRVHPSTRLQVDELTRQVVVDYALGRYDAVHDTTEVIARGLDGVSEINVLGTAMAVAGWARVEQGDAAGVAVDMEALLVRYLNEGEMQHVPSIILALARALLAEGRADEAAAHLQGSWDVPELQRFVRARLWYRHDLALAELLAGRTASAVAGFEAMLDDATAVANPQEQARAQFWLGLLDRRAAAHHRAEGHLHDALETHAEHGYRQMAAGALEAVAGLELDHARPAVAARLLAAAAAVRAEAGVTYRLGWQAEYDADLDRARTSLDDGAFAEAWRRGSELDLAEAVELARRGRGERGRPTFGW
ncbi:MAG: cytochrome P450, partial [Acidimicrobiales bacterium]|nr:cytochrome P450 [Acidimicrobiales bacterium]